MEIAETGVPMCQDTGIMIFYVKVGDKFPFIGEIKNALTIATRKATIEVPIRPNAVNPINPMDKLGDCRRRFRRDHSIS